MRLLLLLLVSASIAPGLPALAGAEDEVEPVLTRLESERAADLAWGAYLAGREGIQEAVPRLLEVLRELSGRETGGWFPVRAHILDGLILLGARVPADLLAPRSPGAPVTESVILMARDSWKNREEILLLFRGAFVTRHVDALTTVEGDLLATAKTPGFAKLILPRAEFHLVLTVREGGGASGLGGSVRFHNDHRHLHPPRGFPPVVTYSIRFREGSGLTRFVDGPHPAWFGRMVTTARCDHRDTIVDPPGYARSFDAADLVPRWLGTLLDRDPGIRRKNRATIAWSDAAGYQSLAGEARDRLLAAYWSLVLDLVSKDLLNFEAARSCAPRIEVEVKDERKDRSVTIPPLPETKVRPPF